MKLFASFEVRSYVYSNTFAKLVSDIYHVVLSLVNVIRDKVMRELHLYRIESPLLIMGYHS